MKGHIAFCPHFHQPHFQLHKTRNEAFINSYLPWVRLLEQAMELESFYINLHFSGPFLYWLKDQKNDYLQDLRQLFTSKKAGVIGGLADEPFVQLSSRRDDFLYQLKKYDELVYDTLGVSARDWQGIHLVERECGEMVLGEMAYAAGLMQTAPIFYLDAETFYESHFSYPGSDSDYCLKHFGFSDPFSKTTISHIPQGLLFFALRDEIAGQQFFSMPVHSQFRYQLLKRQGFTAEDNKRVKPQHYLFYVKDALEKAAQMAKIYGKGQLRPIVVLFEDAEKFGQWSKDPAGDTQWLLEFFRLVEEDREVSFIGLKDYLQQQKFLDTYPVKSSHSYKEWENWTAKRGIRGVTFGDERLRRVICRLRDVESMQAAFEEGIIADYVEEKCGAGGALSEGRMTRALMQSAERFDIVNGIIKAKYPPEINRQYETVNRVRNLVYQEDPKWASRHPSYGSSPYYDINGLAYLELAIQLMKNLNKASGIEAQKACTLQDWDMDGEEEITINNGGQFLVLDGRGGCIIFHQVINMKLADDVDRVQSLLADDIEDGIKAYNTVRRNSFSLVFTETDSRLGARYYAEGGRQEVCRNSWRCSILWKHNGQVLEVGDLQTADFVLDETVINEKGVGARLICPLTINAAGQSLGVIVKKTFQTANNSLTVLLTAEVDGELAKGELFLLPQIITSATPSDEIDFNPHAYLGIMGGIGGEIGYRVGDISVMEHGGITYKQEDFSFSPPEVIDYVYEIKNGVGETFNNLVRYSIAESGSIQSLAIEPAVKNYYQDYVFEDQSRLGYHSSGLSILPLVAVKDGRASIEVVTSWEFDYKIGRVQYGRVCHLIESKK